MQKKINKEFLITDSSLNCYSYRLLTSGYQLDEFKRNPIGYYMHGTDEFPREMGVLVKWEDFRVDGDKVYAKPCINLTHPRGQRTIEEIENGFLNGASLGHIVALEISDEPNDYLPNQKGPTVKKWFNRECSPVDMPGNYQALTNLYDKNDQLINLADFSGSTININEGLKTIDNRIMMLQSLTWSELDSKGLLPELKEKDFKSFSLKFKENFGKEYSSLRMTSDEVEQFNKRRAEMSEDEKALDSMLKWHHLQERKAQGYKAQPVHEQLSKALKEKNINTENVAELKRVFKNYPIELEEWLKHYASDRLSFLHKLSFDELDKQGLLSEYKERYFEGFRKKFIEKFGVKYEGQPPHIEQVDYSKY